MRIECKKFISIVLVMVLFLGGIVPTVTNVHAEDIFKFDGSNADQYNNQTTIEFNMDTIDMTNNQVVALMNQCDELVQKVIFDKSVKVIGKEVFKNCYALECVDFSRATQLKVIEDYAFWGCSTLCQSVYNSGSSYITTAKEDGTIWLPSGLSYFGESCFGNAKVKDYSISLQNNSFKTVDGVLYNSQQNTIIAFPPQRSGSYTIPDSVSTIYRYAFETSLITRVSIPSTVTSIGTKAFYNSALRTVTFSTENSNVSIGSGAFYQDPANTQFANSGAKQWQGISQVYISEETYNSSAEYITNTDETACFTPYVTKEESQFGYALGCDIYVVPKIKVTGIPVNWSPNANLNFYWNNTTLSTVTALYLDGNREVTFDAGSTSSNPIEIKENGSYTLTVNYKNKNGNIATTFMTLDIRKVDSIKPAKVTYTLVDDVCYLHSYDTESGLDQIKYILNEGDVTTYSSSGFTLSPGTNTVTTWANDCVGNSSEKTVYTIIVPDKPKTISLNCQAKQLTKGKTFQLSAVFSSDSVENRTITWSSSDESVASVDASGIVTGVRVGYAVITAMTASGYKAKCSVVVTKDPTTKKTVTMYKSNTYKLLLKNTRSDYDISYSSDDPKICTVNDSGKITAKGIGEGTVLTKIDTGVRVYTLKTVVTVKKPSVQITKKPKSLKVGKTYKLKALRNGLSTSLRWSSSKKSVATINKTTGKVIAQGKGTTVITAKCGKYKASFKLKVK